MDLGSFALFGVAPNVARWFPSFSHVGFLTHVECRVSVIPTVEFVDRSGSRQIFLTRKVDSLP